MIKNKKVTAITAITAIIVLLVLSSCKSVKDGLSGRKQNNSDEFLIKKKTPLVLPPDFEKLPTPNNEMALEKAEEENIEKLIALDSFKNKNKNSMSKSKTIEGFVLEQIKKD